MKYSVYLQLRDILDENGISWKEFKKDPKLYEGILSNLGKGLWNMAKKGMKIAVSKGISANQKEQLNKAAENIRTWILEEVERGKTDSKHSMNRTLIAKKDAIDKLKDASKIEKDKLLKAIRVYDKELSNFLRKKVNIKVKAIEQKIIKNKNIVEKDKDALQEYWDEIAVNLEISVAQALADADIIEEDSLENWFKQISRVEYMEKKHTTEEELKKN